jgi:hypothetical protein
MHKACTHRAVGTIVSPGQMTYRMRELEGGEWLIADQSIEGAPESHSVLLMGRFPVLMILLSACCLHQQYFQ